MGGAGVWNRAWIVCAVVSASAWTTAAWAGGGLEGLRAAIGARECLAYRARLTIDVGGVAFHVIDAEVVLGASGEGGRRPFVVRGDFELGGACDGFAHAFDGARWRTSDAGLENIVVNERQSACDMVGMFAAALAMESLLSGFDESDASTPVDGLVIDGVACDGVKIERMRGDDRESAVVFVSKEDGLPRRIEWMRETAGNNARWVIEFSGVADRECPDAGVFALEANRGGRPDS